LRSIIVLPIAILKADQPPLWFLIAYLLSTFFCQGILWGALIGQRYLNTIEPMLLGIAILSGSAKVVVRWADSDGASRGQTE
jgi:hypothetical protein